MTFESFAFQPFIYQALNESGFETPTEVQEKLIPLIQKRRNIVGRSQTGTGKTHTLLLPLIDQVEVDKDEVQVVITTPSRELAEQIYQAAKQITAFAPKDIRVSKFVGGTDKQRQLEQLQHQQPQIVIGTPGRILDMVNENALLIYKSRAFVVDEADMTLDLGFLPEVDQIATKFSEDIQMMVFSATIPEKLRPFLKKYVTHPVVEDIKPQSLIADTIENWLISTKGRDKNQLIFQLLTIGQPYLAVVFANTKEHVDEISDFLQNQGLKVATIHGDIPARQRKRIMRQIHHLDYQYIVATDLAARGIDIEGISHVINAELPRDLDFFIHRVGRTGRNQLKGTAITLYDSSDEYAINSLEKMGIDFEPKEIKQGEIVTTYDRNRRQKREKTSEELDPETIGYVKKQKKKVKPGYKKKIKQEINKSNQEKRKLERRKQQRAAKREKKNSNR